MGDILPGWTTEAVTALVKVNQAGRARAIANASYWRTLGHDQHTAWGQYKGNKDHEYQVMLDLVAVQQGNAEQSHCTCKSYERPCKHIMALLYLLVEASTAVPEAEAPQFVQAWLSAEQKKLHKRLEKQQKPTNVSPDAVRQRGKQYEKRKQNIAAGMDELEAWLINMIRHGLADPQIQRYDFWDAKARRMVDAQAPGVADWLRELASLPASGTSWIEPLLDQLGRLYLLVESFKRFDELAPETQADIRTVLGWSLKAEEVKREQPVVRDEWLVLGKHVADAREKLRVQRIWLRGRQTLRDALILEFAWDDAPFQTQLRPGVLLDAGLCFYPSRYPLRALIAHSFGLVHNAPVILGTSILEGIEAYSDALARNPWLPYFPMLLDAVVPMRLENRWILREEADGTYLPIAPRFDYQWSLLALSGGYPIQVAGEWDGANLQPTGAMVGGRFVDFDMIGKIV